MVVTSCDDIHQSVAGPPRCRDGYCCNATSLAGATMIMEWLRDMLVALAPAGSQLVLGWLIFG
jgi:hypothetical protein